MATGPTQRSLAYLRERGYVVEVTEHWNAYARVRQDLFQFIDIVGLKDGELLGVQTTSTANVGARIAKITEVFEDFVDRKTGEKGRRLNLVRPKAQAWLRAGGKIVVHGWGKRGARGKRKVWTLKQVTLTLADFTETQDCVRDNPPIESGA